MDDDVPQSQWPKTYLLQVLDAAVKQGCIRLPFTELYGAHAGRMAKSFIGALNRIRRRSDKQHRSFIIAEYHLVGTTWEAERGTLLVTYSSLPDNMALPKIEAVDASSQQMLPAPEVQHPPEPLPEPQTSRPSSEPFDPAKLIDDLLSNPRFAHPRPD